MTRARNVLKYQGIGRPIGYRVYSPRYSVMSGKKAGIFVQVLSGTAADFDGKVLTVTCSSPNAGQVVSTLTFDDDTVPPSTSTAVNISGLATAADIAVQLALTFTLKSFEVVTVDATSFWVFQPAPGDSGNTLVETTTGDLTGEIAINEVTDLLSNTPKFYGGVSIDTPTLWGLRRGFSQGERDLVKSVPAGV